ncbi:MAG: hypothetical protein HY303_19255 [Candidatus Wallbacteria bacterium]|nr:hypothetical protein [Candidatus Wallbacteria bacterium]
MPASSPAKQLESFLSRYDPKIAVQARGALAILRKRMPGAIELVYDNYNALVIAFGSTERMSDIVCSIALYPRWVSLFLMHGVDLPDPRKLLKGSGKGIRQIVLAEPKDLETPGVRDLLGHALRLAEQPMDPKSKGRMVIQSISPKQRPRRPAEK